MARHAAIGVVLAATALPCARLDAQDGHLVQNGGFESGAIAPWKIGGSTANARIEAGRLATCQSRVLSAAYGVDVAANGQAWIAQTVQVPIGELELGLDITCSFAAPYRFDGTVVVTIGSTVVQTWRIGGSGGGRGGNGVSHWTNIRSRQAGTHEFRVTVHYRPTSAVPTRLHLDNIVLRPLRRPAIRQPRCALLSRSSRIVTTGSDRALTVLWVSTRRSPPLRIAPFRGFWELDPAVMLQVGARRNGTHGGFAQFELPRIPNALAGRKLSWQAVEVDPTNGVFGFGYPETIVVLRS